jgi:TatD DNase family protein
MANEHPGYIFATVGVHPCSSSQFDSPTHLPADGEEYLQQLKELAMSSPQVGAFGEIGLDYDRLNYADKATQKKWFSRQLDIAVDVGLPLFLHSRAAADDFAEILLQEERWGKLKGGLVHSFTGTKEEMWQLVNAGLYIGINGCSLKTEENLEVVKEVPLESLMLETDGPWCEIKRTHASAKYLEDVEPIAPVVKNKKWKKGCLVKDRNEPALISNVARVIARVKGVTEKEVVEAAWENTVKLFGRLDDKKAE